MSLPQRRALNLRGRRAIHRQVKPSAGRMHLFRRIWPLLASNLMMLGVSVLCMAILSAMRGYVGGESLWSKAQKDAVTHLSQYARDGNLAEFRKFRESL